MKNESYIVKGSSKVLRKIEHVIWHAASWWKRMFFFIGKICNEINYQLINRIMRRFFETTLLKKRQIWHRCFPVNFAKFVRTPFLQNTSGRLLWIQYLLQREIVWCIRQVNWVTNIYFVSDNYTIYMKNINNEILW